MGSKRLNPIFQGSLFPSKEQPLRIWQDVGDQLRQDYERETIGHGLGKVLVAGHVLSRQPAVGVRSTRLVIFAQSGAG